MCDINVYTSKGISVDRITFDKLFWENKLLPKLADIFDNCLARGDLTNPCFRYAVA